MEFLLRNAVSLEHNPSSPTKPVCSGGMSSITFRERDEGVTTLSLIKNADSGVYQIASSSGATTPKTSFLTSDAVNLVDPSNPGNSTPAHLFDCEQTNNAGAYVTVHFTLYKTNTGLGSDNPSNANSNTESQNFNTSVNLRSF